MVEVTDSSSVQPTLEKGQSLRGLSLFDYRG
jgi:hypothetical protein